MEETTTIPRTFRQEGSQSQFSRLMASSTPLNSQRPNTLPKRVNIHAKALSSLQQEIPRNSTPIVKIRPKDYNLWLNGKEVERFIKQVETIAEIEGGSGRDISDILWTKDQEIGYHIEGIPRYETGECEQLRLDMKRIWGKISPERRYQLSSITQLSTNIQKGGGIRNMTQYKKFIRQYETIINYLKRYQHIQGDINHNQEILDSLS
ncbi:hypothetical protein O181_024370 [Austropuccinia psidii MF-1]|uniref:Uncharacterized protein n=1 Tax=Austropuccinia psidii MF-1 TaxID=1389203 RepID=A0A9Q3CKF9_9BASI|nr:hypothetical protein [Austropuccinia psidii MF-1]